jgi:hypothetical protein
MFIVGLITYLGLVILGIPFALPLGILAGLFEIVPNDCVGAVPDCSDGKWGNINRFIEIVNSQVELGDIGWKSGYFNSGMFIVSKEHAGLFDDPENRERIKSQFGDQTILNYNLFKNKYKFFPLDTKYNGMEITGYSSRTDPKNKTLAMIMHFANEGDKEKQMKEVVGEFNEFKDKLLFYDCGELGWSMYLAAHIRYLSGINKNKITVVTYKSRFVLYNSNNVDLIEIPKEIIEQINHLNRDGNHLFDEKLNKRIKHDVLCELFKTHFGKYNVVSEYDEFIGKRVFDKYTPSDNAMRECSRITDGKNVIMVFPRKRSSKFSSRNIPEQFYVELCNELCSVYFNHNIISIGSIEESYMLDGKVNFDNFIDLTQWDDENKLDLMIAMCLFGGSKLAIGSQSSLPKISLLCGVPTYMIGHQKQRHTIKENWSNTDVGFYDLTKNNETYDNFDYKKCIAEIFDFSRIQKPVNAELLGRQVSEDLFYDEEFDSKEILEYVHGTPIIFYDCGELGWSPFISAYIRMFRDQSKENSWRKIIVSTDNAKRIL